MLQIPNIKFISSTESLIQKGDADTCDDMLETIECQRKISSTNAPPSVEMTAKNLSPSHHNNNFGAVTQTLSKQLQDLDRKNMADSVVLMHYVNQNFRSKSESTESKCSDSEISMRSNECDRRYCEIKQWYSNLYHYKRSDTAINLNHRVQLKFQPLKPFVIR